MLKIEKISKNLEFLPEGRETLWLLCDHVWNKLGHSQISFCALEPDLHLYATYSKEVPNKKNVLSTAAAQSILKPQGSPSFIMHLLFWSIRRSYRGVL